MDEIAGQPTVDFREYLEILKGRKLMILLVAAVVLAVATALSLQQTPLYTSKARLLVQPLPSGPASTSALQVVDAEVEAQIVASTVVANKVIADLRLDTDPATLLSRLDVVGGTASAITLASTKVLDVSYTSPDKKEAALLAEAFAENYITYRQEQALHSVSEAQQTIQENIDETSSQLDDLSARVQEAQEDGNQTLVSTLESQRNVLVGQIAVLQQRLNDLAPSATVQSGGAQIIEPANVPISQSSPNLKRNGAIALFLGLALGVGLAFVRERLDNRLRGKSDVERIVDVAVLATVPRYKDRKKQERDLVIAVKPRGIAAESYRSLRTNLQFITAQRRIKTILVTSPSAGEGKTVTSCNLAVALAQAGKRVVLISADLRRPTLESYFDAPNRDGLSTYLTGQGEIREKIYDPGIPNLRLIPSGPIPPNPAELLSGPRLREMVDLLEENADVVLVDSPPVLAVADAAILTVNTGGTLLILDATTTHRSAALQARQAIEKAGGNLIGAVINDLDSGSSPYYYGVAYYSPSYYEADAQTGTG